MDPTINKIVLDGSMKIISELYEPLKQKAKVEIDKANINRKIPLLIDKIDNIRLVKTLWQLDKSVDIETFYCPSHLLLPTRINKTPNRVVIDDVNEFTSKNIVIRGIAGQGKSIFLRHLCIKEFEKGNRIPIFIELRRVQRDESLFYHISRFLEVLDIKIDEDMFKILLKSKKFVLFLDAFDEVAEEQKLYVLNEIENIVASSDCPFVITTRPGSSIEMSHLFDVYTLDNLNGDEYKVVISKLSDTEEFSNTLLKAISQNKAKVSGILCTPLLITLLLITYKSYQKLPEQLSDFYELIFNLLLQRHDGTKAGYQRKRRCSINDSQYRKIFDALCFESKLSQLSIFKYQQLYDLIVTSLTLVGVNIEADDYLKDIKHITCLILEEGNEYRFIHKSVQEYYAASFIKNRPEQFAKQFYTACLKMQVYRGWQQELEFLSEIDKYRYIKYYVIPFCQNWFGFSDNDELIRGCPPVTFERMKMILNDVNIGFRDGSLAMLTLNDVLTHPLFNLEVNRILGMQFGVLIRKINSDEFKINLEKKENTNSEKEKNLGNLDFQVQLLRLVDEGILLEEIKQLCGAFINRVYGVWKESYEFINREDSISISL